jgi:UDP-N-acetylglucosamine/UDP-N-acetylgalactosamine diphosphorylase
MEKLRERFAAFGQDHVFANCETLSEEQKTGFQEQLAGIPVEKLETFLEGAKSIVANDSAKDTVISPFSGPVASSTASDAAEKRAEWKKIGLEAITKGQVAALVLAGGQGTRLGFDGPKGCYDIGMPSKKTLFQLLSERIDKLKQLASTEVMPARLPLYVMTSPLNHSTTVDFFVEHDNFNVDVSFFSQGMLPCLDKEGKILLEGPGVVSMAPDGNGGIYPALEKSGMLAQMKGAGIHHLHVFSIDNALCQPADPVFMGYCISQKADVGNKVLWKASPDEKVGVLAQKGSKSCIVEYSDMVAEMTERVDEKTGKLIFGAANICNHYYALDFLENTVLAKMDAMYHIANKKIPYYDGKTVVSPTAPNGMKLETFIFDVFEFSERMAVLEVERRHEFAPVKNAEGKDSPATAREYLSNLAKEYVTAAGAKVAEESDAKKDASAVAICEVSPLTSYGGEGLEEYSGRKLQNPFSL